MVRMHFIKSVHVLGHMMTTSPGNNSFVDREGLLFVGALRDEGSPNVDSLLWFCVNVLPLIEKKMPNTGAFERNHLKTAVISIRQQLHICFFVQF